MVTPWCRMALIGDIFGVFKGDRKSSCALNGVVEPRPRQKCKGGEFPSLFALQRLNRNAKVTVEENTRCTSHRTTEQLRCQPRAQTTSTAKKPSSRRCSRQRAHKWVIKSCAESMLRRHESTMAELRVSRSASLDAGMYPDSDTL